MQAEATTPTPTTTITTPVEQNSTTSTLDVNELLTDKQPALTDCYYYMMSSCNKAPCTYRHSEMAKHNPKLCLFWLSTQGCTRQDCKYQHPSIMGLLRYNNVCFYNVLGACKNGQRCPFRHLTPAEVKQLLAPRPPSHNHHHHHTHNINSSNSNVTSKKHYDAEQLYKAAGILPYCVQPESKQVLVLLGKDQRKSGQVWSEFGGKRDEKDATSVTTAVRQFCEETMAVFGTSTGQKKKSFDGRALMKQSMDYMNKRMGTAKKVFSSRGKYMLYFVQVDQMEPSKFAERIADNKEASKKLKPTEKKEFAWVPLKDLVQAFKGVEIPMTNTLRKDSGAAAVSKPQAAEPQEAKTYVCGDKEVYDYFVLLLNLLIPEIQDVLQA